MLKILKKENIIEDGVIQANIKGKLIKLYFNNKIPGVIIQLENQDHEIIWVGELNQEHLNIYPRKIIEILDETRMENYYLFPNNLDTNNIFMRITGIKEGESINMIKILYEDMQSTNTVD